MAEVRWIKIVTDIFDDEKILLIETLPEADSIIVIWFKLLCLAGKQNNSGVFMLNDRMPYNEKMFATIFRRKESTVQLAFETFVNFGMIEIIDGAVTIPNWGKHQSLDQIEAKNEYMRKYMREYREKQRLLTSKTNGKVNSKANSKANVSEADKNKIRRREEEDKRRYTPYGDIATAFNTICVSLPEVRTLSDSRKEKVKTRWRELKTLEAFEELFYKVERSDFLTGKSGKWKASFDWLMENDKNYLKVLEGNYENETVKETANPFDELLRKELENEQSRNHSAYEDSKRLLPDVLPGE